VHSPKLGVLLADRAHQAEDGRVLGLDRPGAGRHGVCRGDEEGRRAAKAPPADRPNQRKDAVWTARQVRLQQVRIVQGVLALAAPEVHEDRLDPALLQRHHQAIVVAGRAGVDPEQIRPLLGELRPRQHANHTAAARHQTSLEMLGDPVVGEHDVGAHQGRTGRRERARLPAELVEQAGGHWF
jgi:hypothetical protein